MDAPDTALQAWDSTITGWLCVAFELGEKSWKLSLGNGVRAQRRERRIEARFSMARGSQRNCSGRGGMPSSVSQVHQRLSVCTAGISVMCRRGLLRAGQLPDHARCDVSPGTDQQG